MKPLLRGELRHRCVPALFAGTQRASSVGGTRPPRLSPGGGNGKGGVQTSVPPQAVRVGVVRMPGTPLVYCELTLLPRFSPLRSPNLYVDPLVPLSRNLAGTTHSFCRASIRTLDGPHWARCKLGSDLKPRSITTVTDLDCWVLPSGRRSLKDRVVVRSHPNKAVDVLANKTSRGLLASARSTHVGSASSSGFPNCGCLELALPGWSASGPWPATLLPLSARPGVAAHILLR